MILLPKRTKSALTPPPGTPPQVQVPYCPSSVRRASRFHLKRRAILGEDEADLVGKVPAPNMAWAVLFTTRTTRTNGRIDCMFVTSFPTNSGKHLVRYSRGC